MKLSALNVAIRDLKGNPKINLSDNLLDNELGKTKLLASLKARFVERGAETGLWLDENGYLRHESTRDTSDS